MHITWDSKNVDKVTLGYTSGPGRLDWIANNIPNTGSYDWTINVGNTTNTQFGIQITAYHTGVGSVTATTNVTILPAPSVISFSVNDAQQVAVNGSNFSTLTLRAQCPVGVVMVVNGQWITDSSRSLCNVEKVLYKSDIDTPLNNMNQFRNMFFADELGAAYLGIMADFTPSTVVPLTLTACNVQGVCVKKTTNVNVWAKG